MRARGVPLSWRSVILALGVALAGWMYYRGYVRPQAEQLRYLALQVADLRERVGGLRETLVRFDEVSQRIGALERRWQDQRGGDPGAAGAVERGGVSGWLDDPTGAAGCTVDRFVRSSRGRGAVAHRGDGGHGGGPGGRRIA